jgi:hypothetical protein
MRTLSNNQELYDYLLFLSSELRKRGLKELCETLLFASRHASGISTEFLGESRRALRQVMQQGNDALTEQERDELRYALKQLDKALDKQ